MEQRYYVEQAEHVHRLCRILAKNDVAALVSQMETWQQQEEGRGVLHLCGEFDA